MADMGSSDSGSNDGGADAFRVDAFVEDGGVDGDGDGVLAPADCDDTDANRYPGNAEVCDGVDNDCNDLVDDEPTDGATYYADTDDDGFGDPADAVVACEAPTGYVDNGWDCRPAEEGGAGEADSCAISSCAALLAVDPDASSGDYHVDFGTGPALRECDMTTDDGGFTLVASEDFSTTPMGWFREAMPDDLPYAETYSCAAFGPMLGGYENLSTADVYKDYDLTGIAHTEVRAQVGYVKLDSWDGEDAYVQLDGMDLYRMGHSFGDGAEVCGWNRGGDLANDLVIDVDGQVDHTGDTVRLTVGSDIDQAPSDESYGVQRVAIWVR